jgi:hypothetical protein
VYQIDDEQFVVNGYQETSFQLILIVKQAVDIAFD